MTFERSNLLTGPAMDRPPRLLVALAALLAGSYLVAGCLFLTPFLSNADAVPYISISQKYARGEFSEAVNGYWSPLLSWLLVPPILLSFNPALAAKVLILICGLALSLVIFLVGRRFGLSPGVRLFLAALALPIILFRYVLGPVTPDLLAAAILVYYLHLVFDPEFLQKKATWPLVGLVAALGYFAKSYLFFFFLAHFAAVSMYNILRLPKGSGRKKAVGRVFGTVVIFLAVSGAWITALSLKYHRLTISTSGRIALSLHAPQSKGHFTAAGGLIPPPNPTAVSAWEDPSLYPFQPAWNPLRSLRESRHLLSDLRDNARDMANILTKFSLWSLVILPLAFLLSLWPRRHGPVFMSLVTLLIYDSGYAIVGVNTRYLYINEVLILLLAGYMLRLGFRAVGPGRWGLKAGLMLALALPFLLTPYTLSAKFPQEHPALFRGKTGDPGKTLYFTGRRVAYALSSQDAEAASGRRAVIASDSRYQDSLILAYYAQLGYCGVLAHDEGPPGMREELIRNGVDYFLLWEKPRKDYPFLEDCPELDLHRQPRLRVFDLRRLRSAATER